jgi:hypothetical protein
MNELKNYRQATAEEQVELDIYEDYSALLGPKGFCCVLTEPEDRCWYRDLDNVIVELNKQNSKLEKYQALAGTFREGVENFVGSEKVELIEGYDELVTFLDEIKECDHFPDVGNKVKECEK